MNWYADDATLSPHNPFQVVLLFQPGMRDQYKAQGVFWYRHLSQGLVFLSNGCSRAGRAEQRSSQTTQDLFASRSDADVLP